MPYVTEARKAELDRRKAEAVTAGDLTYLLYKACIDDPFGWSTLKGRFDRAIDMYMPKKSEPRYENYCTVLGSFDSTRRELKRRNAQGSQSARHTIDIYVDDYYHEIVAPYEDKKIEENGDVVCD